MSVTFISSNRYRATAVWEKKKKSLRRVLKIAWRSLSLGHFLSRSESLALVFSADMKTFGEMTWHEDPHLIQLFNFEKPSSSHSVSNVTSFDLHEIKKKIRAVFPDMPAAGCTHRKPHGDQQSLMNKNCSKPSFHLNQKKTFMTVKKRDEGCVSAFLLWTSFLAAKQSSLGLWWGTLSPRGAARQDQIPGDTCCQEQVLHSAPQILSPSFPRHLALHFTASVPEGHWQHQEEKHAHWGSPVGWSIVSWFRPGLCPQTRAHGYSQCATKLSKAKTFKILWKYGLWTCVGAIISALKTELVNILWLSLPLTSSLSCSNKGPFLSSDVLFHKQFSFLMTNFIKITQ